MMLHFLKKFISLWNLLIQSGMFITRLPLSLALSKNIKPSPLGSLTIFFPLWGAVIALMALIPGLLVYKIGLPWPLVCGLIILCTTLFSGALHEDGLADCCDGFWGGNSPEKRYAIMKDSAVGSYGVLGLILVTGLRWMGLSLLPTELGSLAFLIMHILPRGLLGGVWYIFPSYAQQSLTVEKPTLINASLSMILTIIALSFFPLEFQIIINILIICGVSMLLMAVLGWKKMTGLNGDCIGGCEQIGQVAVILSFHLVSIH